MQKYFPKYSFVESGEEKGYSSVLINFSLDMQMLKCQDVIVVAINDALKS